MFLERNTSTVHRKKELPLMCSTNALQFPRNSTDMQPPPATALRDELLCGDVVGMSATAALSVMEQPVTLTFNISKAAMAPPHVEQGSMDWLPVGHPMSPPTAAFPL